MNYLVLSKLYNIIENEEHICEHSKNELITVKNYKELEDTLISYNYDFTPENILIDIKTGNSTTEEVLATSQSLSLVSDNKEISYQDTRFIIKWFCEKKAVIEVRDEKKYCKECFEKLNKQQSFKKIKSIFDSKDEMNGLSTTQKIEYILIKNIGNKISASEIFDIGDPWNLSSFTPKNSVYARLSSLYKKGSIKRDGIHYYI